MRRTAQVVARTARVMTAIAAVAIATVRLAVRRTEAAPHDRRRVLLDLEPLPVAPGVVVTAALDRRDDVAAAIFDRLDHDRADRKLRGARRGDHVDVLGARTEDVGRLGARRRTFAVKRRPVAETFERRRERDERV